MKYFAKAQFRMTISLPFLRSSMKVISTTSYVGAVVVAVGLWLLFPDGVYDGIPIQLILRSIPALPCTCNSFHPKLNRAVD